MTRAHLRANWSGVPSPTDHWIGALLRAAAMLVLYAASIFRMRLSLFSGECHTDAEPDALPEQESGIILERKEAAESSQTAAQPQLTCATAAADGGGGDDDGGGGGDGDNAPVSRQPDCLTDLSRLPPKGTVIPEARMRYPGPIPRYRDSRVHGSRLYGAHAPPAGMTSRASD